jgi:hypothetical protein
MIQSVEKHHATFSLQYGIKTKPLRLIKFCLNETYNKVRINKHLSDAYPIHNGVKGDALSPFLSNSSSENAIRKDQEYQVEMESNGTHKLLVSADVNVLGENRNAVKNTGGILDTRKVSLEVNARKTKYMIISRHRNAG